MAVLDNETGKGEEKTPDGDDFAENESQKERTSVEAKIGAEELQNGTEHREEKSKRAKKSNTIAPIDKTSVHKICSGQVGVWGGVEM